MTRLRLLLPSVLAVALCAPLPLVAVAGPPVPGGPGTPQPDLPTSSPEISVISGPGGVTIYIGIRDTTPGTAGSPGSGSPIGTGSGDPKCTSSPVNIGNASVAWLREGLAAHPDTTPWAVNCDNGYFGIAWVPVSAPSVPAVVVGPPLAPVDPVAIAAEVFGIVPLPPIRVGANPRVGLVAMPSWFWIDGYDGRRLSGSRAVGLTVVEVEIWPANYHWSFGDGAALDTLSVGRPYPEESDIRHTYEQSSLRTGGTFSTQLEINFAAQFRVNGGAWQPLAPVVQTYSRAYPVQQLQSVLTSNR